MNPAHPLVWIDGATGTLGRAACARLTGDTDPFPYRILTLCRKAPASDWPYPVEVLPEDPDDYRHRASLWAERYGTPRALVCLSGVNLNQLFLKTPRRDFQRLFDVNFSHTAALVDAILPLQFQAGGGSIVVCSSLASRHPKPGQAAYAASKGALDSWVRTVATEIGRKGCRLNAVAPGFIDSPMFRQLPPARQEAIVDSIPLKRTGQPEEIAGLIEFLISDKSSYLTGQIIPVTGGL